MTSVAPLPETSSGRHSRRLSLDPAIAAAVPDDSPEDSVSEWGTEDGESGPENDAEWSKLDKQWAQGCLNKNVYFRWSTSFNSVKNRFKGVVTSHKSRVGPRDARLDFLVIKTYGFSEDRYVMGKDIRELYVFPNKGALMDPTGSEEDLKKRAIRKWSSKDGWVDLSATKELTPKKAVGRPKKAEVASGKPGDVAEDVRESEVVVSSATASTVCSPRDASSGVNKRIKKVRTTIQRKIVQRLSPKNLEGGRSPARAGKSPTGIFVHAKHKTTSMASRIQFFSFYKSSTI